MKVLMINSFSGRGSTGRICTDLADVLFKQGNECRIAYGRDEQPEKYKSISYRIGSNLDVYNHALKSRFFDNSGFCSTHATKKLIKWIQEYNPDIIHLHNLHGYYLNVEVLFRYLATCNKPIVWTLHDCWSFTGHCCYFHDCMKWKTGCNHCPYKNEYPASLLFDNSKKNWEKKKSLFTLPKNMVLVSPSQWLADLVAESYLGKYPIRVIPNGIDTTKFKPTQSDFKKKYHLEDKKVILGVANVWDKRKGLDDFISLSSQLDSRYVVVLVGLSPKQIKSLPKNVIGLPRTNSVEELAGIYSSADVFLNLTYEDNYPTTNLESQCCGTPCITYATGGSVESVPKENIISQGKYLEVLPQLERNLSIARKELTIQRMTDDYLVLLHHLTNTKNKLSYE